MTEETMEKRDKSQKWEMAKCTYLDISTFISIHGNGRGQNYKGFKWKRIKLQYWKSNKITKMTETKSDNGHKWQKWQITKVSKAKSVSMTKVNNFKV